MRKICYSAAMSLDGYVAGPNGESDWIIMNPDIDFAALMGRFDTILMGRRTFEAAQSMGGGAAMPGTSLVVFSRTMRQVDQPHATIVGSEFHSYLSQLRGQAGRDVWLFGGGTLFSSLLEAGFVDVVEVAVMPVLLGGGTPLLKPIQRRFPLKLVGSRTYEKSGTVFLEYVVQSGMPLADDHGPREEDGEDTSTNAR
jgi:dihydrofolate reductase